MKLSMTLVSASFLLAGCGETIVEAYSETPVAPACAVGAISKIESVGAAESSTHSIRFEGALFSGELFYGSGGKPFTTYGINVSSAYLLGPAPLDVADLISSALAEECATDAT